MRVSIGTVGVLCLVSLVSSAAETVTLRPAVAHLVSPVLRAYAHYVMNQTRLGPDKLEAALETVLYDRSKEGTEALAVLAGIYIGEHSAEDVSCELVARGAVAVPFLRLYSTSPVKMPGVDMRRFERNTSQYEGLIQRIDNGEHCERED
jgi:hypothetical protein